MIERFRYIEQVTPFIDKPVIKVFSGIRRSGKSVLLKQVIHLLKERGISSSQIIHINMELMEFDEIKNYQHLHQYITRHQKKGHDKYYIFIDEVQDVEGWEKTINS